MHPALSNLRAAWRRRARARAHLDAEACSWDRLRATYEEQAARGVPEAIEGLRRIEQGRWPTSGRPRDGAGPARG